MPTPAGPITTETTSEGIKGNSILKIKVTMAQRINPRTEFIINFFKKNSMNIVTPISIKPIIIKKNGSGKRDSGKIETVSLTIGLLKSTLLAKLSKKLFNINYLFVKKIYICF